MSSESNVPATDIGYAVVMGVGVIAGLFLLALSFVTKGDPESGIQKAVEKLGSEWSEARPGDLVEWPDGTIYVLGSFYPDGINVWTGRDYGPIQRDFKLNPDMVLIKQDSPEYPAKATKFTLKTYSKKEEE